MDELRRFRPVAGPLSRRRNRPGPEAEHFRGLEVDGTPALGPPRIGPVSYRGCLFSCPPVPMHHSEPMIPQLKRLILHALYRFGYVVLKRTDYERLIAVPSAPKIEETAPINPTGAAALPDQTTSIMPREMPASAEFLTAIEGACEPSRAAALYSVARYLVEANIEPETRAVRHDR
jgi:hypothetical protein